MDNVIANKFLQQAMDIWIKPEIEKRINKGKLSKNFNFKAGQVVLHATGIKHFKWKIYYNMFLFKIK